MSFVPLVSRAGLFARALLILALVIIIATMVVGAIQYPLTTKNDLTYAGQSVFLAVPTAIIHGFMNLIMGFVQYLYTQITNLITKPLQSAGSSISGGLNSAGSTISGWFGSL